MEHRRFQVRWMLGSVLLAVWAAATVVAAGTPQETTTAPDGPDWLFECAACFHTFYDLGSSSAQVNAAGAVHVVYGGEALYHAWQSAGGWQIEIVDDGPEVGSQAALVIGSDATFHVFYLDEKIGALRYASGSTGSWAFETITTGIGDEPWPSTAIAVDGQLHVAFRDGIQNQIVSATRSGSSWSFSTVDATGGYHPSLALDSSGRPHLSYVMAVPGELRYAYGDEGWQVETVSSDVRSLQSGLAVDAAGRPHLAYSARPEPDSMNVLMYAYQDTDGWHHEVADAQEDVFSLTSGIGYDISLALDDAGRPHVGYTSFSWSVNPYPERQYFNARYATREEAGWSIEVLDEYGGNEGLALVLSEDGRPHLLTHQSGAALVHRFVTDSWHSELVDSGGVAGVGASMAIDAKGRTHISSVNTDNKVVVYSLRSGGIWEHETPFDVFDEYLTALALDGDDYPHLLFKTYGRTWDLMYIHRDVDGWEYAWPLPVSPLFYDIAITPDAQVHAVWVGWGGGSLYYSLLPNLSPYNAELVSASYVRDHALVAHTDGGLHVAYASDGGLRYAFRDAGSWHEEVVASSTFSVGHLALALDENGRPHISFYAGSSGDLFYAYRDNGGWHLEQVDWAGDVGQFTSIAVMDSGQPHISYYDATNQDLKYAGRDGTGWVVETVATEGNVGLYTSIAIYNGYPQISYHDATRGDLMYVYKPFIPVAFGYLPLVAR
jgi:hypothetical protein